MTSDIKNTAASVHQRLLNKAKESSRPFNELLQRFALESARAMGAGKSRGRRTEIEESRRPADDLKE